MPTTNPVPSTDPGDLLFNAGKLDEVVNGAGSTYTDRTGVTRRTLGGIDAEAETRMDAIDAAAIAQRDNIQDAADLVLAAAGYAPPVAYAAGISLTLQTQTVSYNGDTYAPKQSELPFTTSGTFETAKFRLIQGVASSDLAASSGSALVGYDGGTVQDVLDGAKSLQDYAALRAYTGRAKRIYITGLMVTVKPSGIAGVFQYDPTDTTSVDNNSTIIVLADGRRFKRDYSGEVSIGWFGVSTSASASENTAAIQAAANYCESTGQFLRGVAGTYITNGTLTINCSGDLSEMTLNVTGAAVNPAIRVGKTGSFAWKLNTSLPNVNYTGHVPGDGWATYGDKVGVAIDNLYDSNIFVPGVTGFGVGLWPGGTDQGFSYNEIKTGYLVDNKINLKIARKTATGWANSNTFIISRCRHSGAEGNGGVPFVGTRNIYLGDGANENLLIRPCMEGSSAVTEFSLELYNAVFNTILQPRYEDSVSGGGSGMRIRLEGVAPSATTGNVFIGGYDYGLDYTIVGNCSNNTKIGTGRGDQSFSVQEPIGLNNPAGNSVAQSHLQGFEATINPLGKNSTATDYSYRVYANGIEGKRSTDANPRMRINWNAGEINLGVGGTNALTAGIAALGATSIGSKGDWLPFATNTYDLGISSYRWQDCFLVNAPNVSSDANTKQQVRELSEAEKATAIRCKGLIRAYKLNSAVAEKGENARIHFGAIAQCIKSAFEAEGLDPFAYGLLCYDQWDGQPEERDEDGNVVTPGLPAGQLYSLRYEELLAFIIAAL